MAQPRSIARATTSTALIRRSSNFNTQRINHIYIDPHNAHKARMKLHYADLTDASSLRRWLDTIAPDEVYNLAAQSHVAVSFEIPDYTADVVATGALRLLEAVRNHVDAYRPHQCQILPGWVVRDVRVHSASPVRDDAVSSPIPLRRLEMRGPLVHRELPRGLRTLRYAMGFYSTTNLPEEERISDWGFAGDYVEASVDDAAAGEARRLRGGHRRVPHGGGGSWRLHLGKKVLGWKPKVGFQQLVKMMVDEDVELAKREKVLVDAGYMDAQQQP
ncbi:hypothetical protein M0R45_004017 [Rubus argutus]|uniref:GDP-mannose 4,6-dehydratase n=1 Tax=Rubus argutus TaxID=59490 RepID=A0AAW1YH46_RUBAR